MSSFPLLCYHGRGAVQAGPEKTASRPGDLSGKNEQKKAEMTEGTQRIQVIGQNPSLLEGVYDLLQLAGYQVDVSSSWAETEYAMHNRVPNLVIVDLSCSAAEAYRLSQQIRSTPQWSQVPILFVSFSGDDRIRDLQRISRKVRDGKIFFYAHTLLSMNGLLDKVKACLT